MKQFICILFAAVLFVGPAVASDTEMTEAYGVVMDANDGANDCNANGDNFEAYFVEDNTAVRYCLMLEPEAGIDTFKELIGKHVYIRGTTCCGSTKMHVVEVYEN